MLNYLLMLNYTQIIFNAELYSNNLKSINYGSTRGIGEATSFETDIL